MNNKVSEERNRNLININDDHTLTSKDIIRKINPVVIPRVSSLASMALCERAAYNISFFGMESNNYTADGVIGNAIHRIILKSIVEITHPLKGNRKVLEPSNNEVKKSKALEVFIRNAERDVKINWKHFMLSDVDNPLPTILNDLETRSKRIIDQLFAEEREHNKFLLRPEFTIRNTKIPLEGRLDLLRIKIKDNEQENVDDDSHKNQFYCSYVKANDLVNLDKESVEIIQIKTGNYRQRPPGWNLQADAEALLLMHAFNLKQPPKYTWQFADKDANRKKFNFTKVLEYIDRYIKIWKSEISPEITGFCPNCQLRDGCLNWAFVSNNALTEDERIKRNIQFNLSKKIRKEVSLDDRWKVYVVLHEAEKRQREGTAITNLQIDKSNIDFDRQQITLIGDEYFGQFLDFSVGEHVTISDGNPNLGSNPTALISKIDLDKNLITLEFYRDDLYYLFYDNRDKSSFTIDRFNFSNGLTSMKYLDKFYRISPYSTDIVLKKRKVSQEELKITV